MNNRIAVRCLALLVINAQVVFSQQPTGATIHDLFEQDQRDEHIDFDVLPSEERKKVDARYPVREKLVIEKMQNGGI